jgi:hypothetical protein
MNGEKQEKYENTIQFKILHEQISGNIKRCVLSSFLLPHKPRRPLIHKRIYPLIKIRRPHNLLLQVYTGYYYNDLQILHLDQRSPSGTLGKNVCQAEHLIRTASRMTNNVSAAMQPPRYAAGVACRCAFLAQFFRFGRLRSGSSYGLEHIASSFRLQFYLLRSFLPRSLRSLRSAWSLRAAETASLLCGAKYSSPPAAHNVRHLPVAPSRHI